MNPPRRALILRALAHATAPVLLTLAAATVSGCSLTQNDIVRLPTLRDVEPTGPEGRRCYDRCSQQEMSCRHMCPQNGDLCFDDCVIDTKLCLYDCPELRRPGDVPK